MSLEERIMSRGNRLIPAEVGSGNRAIKAKFDASLWFAQARPDELGALAAGGWQGRGEDASLVRFYVPLEEDVGVVVEYARESGTYVIFSVDRQAAITWMNAHRPELMAADPVSPSRQKLGT
jgi:hypothetical protein